MLAVTQSLKALMAFGRLRTSENYYEFGSPSSARLMPASMATLSEVSVDSGIPGSVRRIPTGDETEDEDHQDHLAEVFIPLCRPRSQQLAAQKAKATNRLKNIMKMSGPRQHSSSPSRRSPAAKAAESEGPAALPPRDATSSQGSLGSAAKVRSAFRRNTEHKKSSQSHPPAGHDEEFSPQLLELYSREELMEYLDVFQLFDKDNSGAIGTSELKQAMESLGMSPSEEEITRLIQEVDANGNGEVDFSEFCTVLDKMSPKSKELTDMTEIINACFQVFDQDGDGTISEAEFRRVFTEIGGFPEYQQDELFKEFDILGNGKIGYEEFAQIVRNYWLDEGEASQ